MCKEFYEVSEDGTKWNKRRLDCVIGRKRNTELTHYYHSSRLIVHRLSMVDEPSKAPITQCLAPER
jgi:hypothetical protein